ncbi:ATP-binding protein [Staphylococcus pseudintermedius]|nr:ATP-binding protein [Staphylococcus pseudintermedius]WMZ77775.1 ATP-binding protein [Staphylococcus pseudintermedius]WMZ90045.1 ATP-binding protein [Staphylococcus pseudintermedius]
MNTTKGVSSQSRITREEHDLHCNKCGNQYDYYEFENGTSFKHGCDCAMIELAKKQTKEYHERHKCKRVESIFKQSIINDELEKVSFDNYVVPENNEQLARAKFITQRYSDNFSMDNKRSLLLQGSFGTGKSHLSMSIVKEVKAKGFSVLYMNVPQLISTIKNTYGKNASMTEKELQEIISEVDLMVFDDFGINMNDFAMSKMFELIESRVGKHNIYTTNLTSNEMNRNKDLQRIFSRLMSNTTLVKMDGDDYRLRGVHF